MTNALEVTKWRKLGCANAVVITVATDIIDLIISGVAEALETAEAVDASEARTVSAAVVPAGVIAAGDASAARTVSAAAVPDMSTRAADASAAITVGVAAALDTAAAVETNEV